MGNLLSRKCDKEYIVQDVLENQANADDADSVNCTGDIEDEVR